MNRVSRALIALSIGAGVLAASPVFAQETKPAQEPFKPILSGKFVPPIHGQAEIQWIQGKPQRKGNQIITTIQVKNMSSAPIAGFKLDEIWYDKNSGVIPGGGSYKHPKMFQPGEIISATLVDDIDARVAQNTYQFSHANGTIKPKKVQKF